MLRGVNRVYTMSQKIFLPPLKGAFSRRDFIAGLLALGLERISKRASLQDIVAAEEKRATPLWIDEAYRIIRSIKTPRITGRAIELNPDSDSKEGVVDKERDVRLKVQGAIDKIAGEGGGRVTLTGGDWFICGPLELRSGVELNLQAGASVIFSGDSERYLPPVRTRWEGIDLFGYSPFIYAYKCSDVKITGDGTLSVDIGADSGSDLLSRRSEELLARKRLRKLGALGVPVSERVFGKGSYLRPAFIQFYECQRVEVSGVRIGAIPFWGIHILYSEDCIIRGVKVESRRINNDGVDVDSSKRVVVESCIFRTGDDCVAIKSGRDFDGRMVNRVSEDIVVRECVMQWGASAGVAIGSEVSGGVRGVYIFRCRVERAGIGVNIKTNLDRGGYISRVKVWGLDIGEVRSCVEVTDRYHSYRGGEYPTKLEGIEISDIKCRHPSGAAVLLTGDASGLSIDRING
jgi:polygalacturonase